MSAGSESPALPSVAVMSSDLEIKATASRRIDRGLRRQLVDVSSSSQAGRADRSAAMTRAERRQTRAHQNLANGKLATGKVHAQPSARERAQADH